MMKSISLLILCLCWLGCTLPAAAQTAPCTGEAYTTNATFFRASATGQSSDVTASKKKALSAARNALSGQIQTKANQALSSQSQLGEAERNAFRNLIQRTTLQEGAHLKVICEDSQQKGGRFHTQLVVELSKAQVLNTLQQQIQADATLKGKFQADKFKAAF